MSDTKNIYYRMRGGDPNKPPFGPVTEDKMKEMEAKHPRSFTRVKGPATPVTKVPRAAEPVAKASKGAK